MSTHGNRPVSSPRTVPEPLPPTRLSQYRAAHHSLQHAISMVKTAERTLDEVVSELHEARQAILRMARTRGQDPADQLALTRALWSVNRIADETEYAGMKLLSDNTGAGSMEGKVFQVGPHPWQTAAFTAGGTAAGASPLTTDMHTDALGLRVAPSARPFVPADALGKVDDALLAADGLRERLVCFRTEVLEAHLTRLAAAGPEAVDAAIADAEVANEVLKLTRAQIMMLAGQAILAHAGTRPEHLRRMLR